MADGQQVAQAGGGSASEGHDLPGCRCGQCAARVDAGESGTVTSSAALPVWTNDEIADFLSRGFWNGQAHHFAVVAGGVLGVNIVALPSAAQFLVREALALWSDVTGIIFKEVASGEQILFTDTQAGAYASASVSGSTIVSATVNVSVDWLARYGTALNTYSFQTYLHEIGHALGLGHAGRYNGSATYGVDALFANDSWSASLMSYFSQTQNSYTAALGFTRQFVVTPAMADVLATTTLYGAATLVRTGDTVYGFGNSSGRAVYDAAQLAAVSYTIFDDGGIDTLDYSGFSAGQRIDLNAESYSNVGGRIGNVAIARGVTIENAAGGAGADILIGNAAANRLSGNAGNDIIDGGAGADELIGGTGEDQLSGGTGDDLFHVDSGGDMVLELAGGGFDTVMTTGSYQLAPGSHIEQLIVADPAGPSGLVLVGNEFGQTIRGNAGGNIVNGLGGGDRLFGLGGDDYYVVEAGDFVSEAADAGYDTVATRTSYQLADGSHVEQLLTAFEAGTAGLVLIGNAFSQTIRGNAGDNLINGLGGGDLMFGLGGSDYYVVDAGDFVAEAADAGFDTVATRTSYQLAWGSHVEQLLTAYEAGTADLVLIGNEFGQTIRGNAGNNILNGQGGGDTMFGLGGNDYYVVASEDRAIEAADGGYDIVASHGSYRLAAGSYVEQLVTTDSGGAAALMLVGNELAQAITGNAGANTIDGGGGADLLIGLGGADTFAFTAAPGAGGVARILDLASGQDRIALDDAVFAGLGIGALAAGAFRTGGAAQDADDRIIYDQATGALLFDADGHGPGAAVQFGWLQPGSALAAGDFVVI